MSGTIEYNPFRDNNENKEIELDNLKKETKKELSEFDYLKESTKYFDEIKDKIKDFPSPIKEKIIEKLKFHFYYGDNTKEKLETIKKLNSILDDLLSVKDKGVDSILEKITDTNFRSELQEAEASFIKYGMLSALSAIIIALVAVATGSTLAFSLLVGLAALGGISFVSAGGVYAYRENKNNYNGEDNELFDILNDIYPDIKKEEFDKITNLYENGDFKLGEFTKTIEQFYKDGKISEQEHKQLLKILDNMNTQK